MGSIRRNVASFHIARCSRFERKYSLLPRSGVLPMPPACGLCSDGYFEAVPKRSRMVFGVVEIQVVKAAVARYLQRIYAPWNGFKDTSTINAIPPAKTVYVIYHIQVSVASGGDEGTLHRPCKLLPSLHGAAAAEGRSERSVRLPADSPRGARGFVRRAGTVETSLNTYDTTSTLGLVVPFVRTCLISRKPFAILTQAVNWALVGTTPTFG